MKKIITVLFVVLVIAGSIKDAKPQAEEDNSAYMVSVMADIQKVSYAVSVCNRVIMYWVEKEEDYIKLRDELVKKHGHYMNHLMCYSVIIGDITIMFSDDDKCLNIGEKENMDNVTKYLDAEHYKLFMRTDFKP